MLNSKRDTAGKDCDHLAEQYPGSAKDLSGVAVGAVGQQSVDSLWGQVPTMLRAVFALVGADVGGSQVRDDPKIAADQENSGARVSLAHGTENMPCASAVAGKYQTQVCLGDLDVTIDNSGFHTLIQQYTSVIQLQQASNRYAFNFLIGPPGHHCHTKAAGFCYSNAGALSVLGTAPTDFCHIIGLDINPDDGLHKTLKRLTS